MNGVGSTTHSGPGRGDEFQRLLDTDVAHDHADEVASPLPTANGSSRPRADGRSTSRSIRGTRRSMSRAGTGHGEVLELHFASVEQKRVRWWKNAAITTLFILSWFLFATILSVYNKWMFSPQYLAFPFPLFVTTLHMVVQWGLAALVRRLCPKTFKPENDPTKKDYVKKAVPTAVATSLDIGLSNLSLKMITLSFYTMCKSSSLIFVLMFAFLLRLEKPSLRLILVITFIAAGVLLMVFTTTTFSLIGLFLVLGASFMGGLRWGLTQLLLKKKEMGMNNPAATVYWIAPAGAVTLALVSMAIEGWIRVWNNDFWQRVGLFKSLFYLLAPGVVAFCMVMSEYYIIMRAGVVPMSIAGIFKEVTTIIVSAWIFGDRLTEMNIIGVIITIGGISLYTYHKYTAALHSAVPLDAHGNPLKEEEAEEVLAVVRASTMDNEEGVRLLEDGGEIEVPIDAIEHSAAIRLLEEAAEGGHGDGEIGYGRTTLLLNRSPTTEHHDQPLFTVGDAEELEHQERVVLGTGEEGSREVGGVGNRIH